MKEKRILVFGDIHGRKTWKEVYEYHKNEVGTVVFLGDYFDNKDWNFSHKEIIENFKDILSIKSEFESLHEGNKVYYLLGNHDLSYLYYNESGFSCSGFDEENYMTNHIVLSNAIKNNDFYLSLIIDIAYFSHAGINPMLIKEIKNHKDFVDPYLNSIKINDLTLEQVKLLTPVDTYRGGKSKYGGLTWNDLNSFQKSIVEYEEELLGKNFDPILNLDKLKGQKNYINVIGHTPVSEMKDIYHNTHTILCFDFLKHDSCDNYKFVEDYPILIFH